MARACACGRTIDIGELMESLCSQAEQKIALQKKLQKNTTDIFIYQ